VCVCVCVCVCVWWWWWWWGADRRNPVAQAFLTSLRGSQLFAMFIQERLEMAASGQLEGSLDPFEQRVERCVRAPVTEWDCMPGCALQHPVMQLIVPTAWTIHPPFNLLIKRRYQARRQQLAHEHRTAQGGPLNARWHASFKKYRRTDSAEQAEAACNTGVLPTRLSGSMRRIVTDPQGLRKFLCTLSAFAVLEPCTSLMCTHTWLHTRLLSPRRGVVCGGCGCRV
jgi:hypothetical protein